jgi:hypothetical protein
MSKIELNALRDCIAQSLVILGNGIIQELPSKKGSNDNSQFANKLLQESLIVVFQIIFILMTEGRSILIRALNDDKKPKQIEEDIRRNISNYIGVQNRDPQKTENKGHDGFNHHKGLSHEIHSFIQGNNLTGIGSSMLFSPDYTPLLNEYNLADNYFQDMIQSLCSIEKEDENLNIDWKTNTIEDVGSIYQSLMELQATIDWEKREYSVYYGDENARKDTGSFYTADELITEIMDMSVVPYLEGIIQKVKTEFKDAEDEDNCSGMIDAILEQLSIVDNACGYGPFLTITLDKIAIKLAYIQSGGDKPSEDDLISMRGKVAEKCIYGVDINPISVELTKIAIWFKADKPNHPLPIIKQQIKLGNSLHGNRFSRAGIIPEKAISKHMFKKRRARNKKHISRHISNEIDDKIARKITHSGVAKEKAKASSPDVTGHDGETVQMKIQDSSDNRDEWQDYEQQSDIEEKEKKKKISELESERKKLLKNVPLSHEHIDQSLISDIFSKIYSSLNNSLELNWAKEFFNATIAPYWWDNKERDSKKAPNPLSSCEMKRYAHWLARKYELECEGIEGTNERESVRFGKVRDRVRSIAEEQQFFHWELEFSEVFSYEEGTVRGGFGCFEGNPPYLGGSKISGATSVATADFLRNNFDGGAKADLVSYFFRTSFDNLEDDGLMAFVTTNAISSGETRECGLAHIVKDAGSITNAKRGIEWPGDAAVTVDLVGIKKGESNSATLDGKEVERISSRLDLRPEYNLRYIPGNQEKRQRGVNPRGKFQIKKEKAKSFIEDDEKNKQVVVPFLSGDDINKDGLSSSFIVNFGEMEEGDASGYSAPFTYVKEHVKPKREKQKNKPEYIRLKEKWWQFEFFAGAISKWFETHPTAFAKSRHATRWIIARIEAGSVCSEGTYVFFFEDASDFAVLQSSLHEHWGRVFGSTLGKVGHRYINACFDPFPFPQDPSEEARTHANEIGERYLHMRQQLIEKRKCTFNDLQSTLDDANCKDKDILKYRQLTVDLDKSVLAMYGWSDVDYCREMQINGEESKFWPKEEVIEEVLIRLIALNKDLTN